MPGRHRGRPPARPRAAVSPSHARRTGRHQQVDATMAGEAERHLIGCGMLCRCTGLVARANTP